MSCDVYEREFIPSRIRRLTQSDLRISMLMTLATLVAMNLIL